MGAMTFKGDFTSETMDFFADDARTNGALRDNLGWGARVRHDLRAVGPTAVVVVGSAQPVEPEEAEVLDRQHLDALEPCLVGVAGERAATHHGPGGARRG